MKELADFLVALGKLLAALDRGAGQNEPAQPVTDCNRLPAAETVTDCHRLPAELVKKADELPAEATVDNLSTPPPKPKKKPWTCVCTCQKCGAEFTATSREARCCPACRSAIRREHMSKVRKAYLEKLQQPAPAPQEDAGTEPAAGGE